MTEYELQIRRLFPTNYLSVLDHFMGLALRWLKNRRLNYVRKHEADIPTGPLT